MRRITKEMCRIDLTDRHKATFIALVTVVIFAVVAIRFSTKNAIPVAVAVALSPIPVVYVPEQIKKSRTQMRKSDT